MTSVRSSATTGREGHRHRPRQQNLSCRLVKVSQTLPNTINAGSHAGKRLARQEFMIPPVGAKIFKIAMLVLGLCRSQQDAASPVHHQARHEFIDDGSPAHRQLGTSSWIRLYCRCHCATRSRPEDMQANAWPDRGHEPAGWCDTPPWGRCSILHLHLGEVLDQPTSRPTYSAVPGGANAVRPRPLKVHNYYF